ncbi:MAG: DUF4198 domain-containing protein [Gemmatimonadaceae bacterium]|nr:DUF4198 domain-containing protein [Gemmatimonadaceae bacterium]
MPSDVVRPATLGRRVSQVGFLCGAIVLGAVSTTFAHDFWIIPDLFAVPGDATIHVSGRSGTRFPNGSAVEPARVSDARVIGASTEMKITEMAVEGTSLRLHQKPTSPGQYLIAVALTPRTTRATPAGLLRFLRLEGGASEAARLEKANAFAGQDSISYTSGSFAFSIVQFGSGGPRAFSTSAGFPLEFVPVNDPAHVHLGDTLHVKIVGAGKPVPDVGVFAGPAADSGATSPDLTLTADANGVVHVPLSKEGAWNLRAAFVYRRPGAAPNEWDVARSTYVFGVSSRH